MHSKTIISFALIATLTIISFMGCTSGEVAVEEPSNPEVLIPFAISDTNEPFYPDNKIFVNDYSNLLHAVFMISGNSRESEYANEAYMPELFPDKMNERAEDWLNLVSVIDRFFHQSGRFDSWFELTDNSYEPSGEVDLSVYPHLVYSYHMHHRGSRFDDEILYDRLSREPSNYLVKPGRYLLGEVLKDGKFLHDDGSMDHKSMSYGLGGVHGHAYAWIIWAKPGGEDNMGIMPEEALEAWLDYSTDEMVEMYRSISRILDEAWIDEVSIYDFGDGTRWNLDAIGAMIRGKKAMYDVLYMFGTDEDREIAHTLFERTVSMFETVNQIVRPWGLPTEVEFTAEGAVAASDEVNLSDWYQFLNHIGGGYSFDREREGTAMFITNEREDLFDIIGELSDTALNGTLEYHLNADGRLVNLVSYEDGSVVDDTLRVSTAGMFITMAGNIYRKGSMFERASDWDSVSDEVAERSRALYDLKFKHIGLLEGSIERMN